MFEEMKNWVQTVLPAYTLASGQWVETETIKKSFIANVIAMGGPQVDVDDRRPRYRVILLGPRDGRVHNNAVIQAAESLVTAALGDSIPCGAAGFRVLKEPQGPGYTTENRPWASIDFQITI